MKQNSSHRLQRRLMASRLIAVLAVWSVAAIGPFSAELANASPGCDAIRAGQFKLATQPWSSTCFAPGKADKCYGKVRFAPRPAEQNLRFDKGDRITFKTDLVQASTSPADAPKTVVKAAHRAPPVKTVIELTDVGIAAKQRKRTIVTTGFEAAQTSDYKIAFSLRGGDSTSAASLTATCEPAAAKPATP